MRDVPGLTNYRIALTTGAFTSVTSCFPQLAMYHDVSFTASTLSSTKTVFLPRAFLPTIARNHQFNLSFRIGIDMSAIRAFCLKWIGESFK